MAELCAEMVRQRGKPHLGAADGEAREDVGHQRGGGCGWLDGGTHWVLGGLASLWWPDREDRVFPRSGGGLQPRGWWFWRRAIAQRA